jgi:peptide/nickel transport system permease protein
MIAFLVQRLYQAVLVMLTVGLIAFALFNYVGDPINSMVGQDTSLADRERLRQELGLNDGFIVQFARFVSRATRGEFGLSYQQARPVGQIILEKMPATLELSFVAATLALAIGVPMGIYTGLHRHSWLSQLLLGLSLVGVSLPTFLIGILLILVFAVTLGWLPSFGRGSVVQFGWWSSGLVTLDGWRAIIMPAVTLSLFQMTLITRLVRAEMIGCRAPTTSNSPGPRADQRVNFGHALKNTLVPVITSRLQPGSIIFAIITENVFQWRAWG